MTIHADGSAEGETKIENQGMPAESARASMSYLQPHMEDTMIRQRLLRSGHIGTGKLIKDDPNKQSDTYSYTMMYKLDDAMNLPGPGAMYVHSPVGSYLSSFLTGINEPDRTVNFQCYGAYAKEEYTINLPKSIELLAIPKDVRLSGKISSYTATYHRENTTLRIVRELEDRTPGNVCTPRDAAEFKPFAVSVMKDLRAQILYRSE
jgi:hypothetical protein